MIYAIMRNGSKVHFETIDALFVFVNTNSDAIGGGIGL